MASIGNQEHAPQNSPTLHILTVNGERVARVPMPEYITEFWNPFWVRIPANWVVYSSGHQENSSWDVLYRTYLHNPHLHPTEDNSVILGCPVDFYVCDPTNEQPEFGEGEALPPLLPPPPLLNTTIDPGEISVYAAAIGPVKSPREDLERIVNSTSGGDALTNFPWLINPLNGTEFLNIQNIIHTRGMEEIQGYVECYVCNEIWSIRYNLYRRFNELGDRFWEASYLMNGTPFYCDCNGIINPVVPVYDSQNINWLFLYLSKAIGYCSKDQLRHFCTQRRIMPPNGLYAGRGRMILQRQVYRDMYTQLRH